MLLEQTNKKRMTMARREQDRAQPMAQQQQQYQPMAQQQMMQAPPQPTGYMQDSDQAVVSLLEDLLQGKLC